jgi:hypothetical protein
VKKVPSSNRVMIESDEMVEAVKIVMQPRKKIVMHLNSAQGTPEFTIPLNQRDLQPFAPNTLVKIKYFDLPRLEVSAILFPEDTFEFDITKDRPVNLFPPQNAYTPVNYEKDYVEKRLSEDERLYCTFGHVIDQVPAVLIPK